MKILLLAALVVVFSSNSIAQSTKINQLSDDEIKQGWQLLFNGKDLTGWKMFNGGEVTGWKVIDGILTNSGVGSDHGGDIVTQNDYQNFELYLEWKIAPEGNSGIFIHVQEGKTKAIYESGPEYQLLDDKGWPTKLDPSQYSGANYAMHAPKNALVNPIDQWNTTRIVINNEHVQHYLNGQLVVDYNLWSDDWEARKSTGKWKDSPEYGKSKTGKIGLQDHGGLTQFRNVKIKVL